MRLLPPGKILCSWNGDYIKWQVSKNGKREYLTKKEKGLAMKLAEKKYLQAHIADLLYEKKILMDYINKIERHKPKVLSLTHEKSAYKPIITAYMNDNNKTINEWLNRKGLKEPLFPEKLVHHTLEDYYVRSKSEEIIANLLYLNGIPYKYERELLIDGVSYFPDFTIIHPKTGKIFYWEHMGMMDNAKYRRGACDKVFEYGKIGVYPDINLILTYETDNRPIDSVKVQQLIDDFLLN